MKHILYDMGIYFLWFTRIIFKAILNSLNNVSQRDLRGRGGHNWEKYFIGLFHVSEHLGHFKAIKKKSEKKPNSLVKDQTISGFFSWRLPFLTCLLSHLLSLSGLLHVTFTGHSQFMHMSYPVPLCDIYLCKSQMGKYQDWDELANC